MIKWPWDAIIIKEATDDVIDLLDCYPFRLIVDLKDLIDLQPDFME